MNDAEPQASESEEIVDLVLADYFLRSENGENINRSQFIAAQPAAIAYELRRFFAVHDSLGQQISGLHQLETEARAEETSLVSRFFEPRVSEPPQDTFPGGRDEEDVLFDTFPVDLGGYRLLKRLGRGGMGTVFLALELASENRQVALKIPNAGRNCPRELVGRLLREARLAKQLKHPNICEVYDDGIVDGLPYIAMQVIEGQSLDILLAQSPNPWPAEDIAKLMLRAATTLQVAHEKGIIHRDLKPSNFMVDKRGEPVLTDFGLAFQFDDDPGVSRLTRSSIIVGTLAYISPELARSGRPAVVPASDVYSLGVMFYEMLTGQRPFQDEEGGLFPAQILTERPRRHPADIYPEVDRDLAAICMRMLEKNLERRTPSMAAVAEQLQRWVDGERNFITALPPQIDGTTTGVWTVPSTVSRSMAFSNATIKKIVWSVLGFAAVMLTFLVIRVQTDRGQLIITSPADLDIAIKRNGIEEKELKLTAGPNDVSIFSGRVEVVIRGANADHYLVKNGKFTLSRNDRTVVDIERIDTAPVAGEIKPEIKSEKKLAEKLQITGEFIPLFNGQDLQNWVLDGSKTTAVSVNDGVLTADNSGPPNFWDHFVSARHDYANFHLRCQFKKDDLGRGLPSILVRVDPSPIVFGGMRGYLVRIDKSTDADGKEIGNVVSLHLSSRVRVDFELDRAKLPTLTADAWHTLEIIVKGQQIDVLVDGQSVLTYHDEGNTFPRGAVALRFVDAAKSMFREVAIKELPPSPPAETETDTRRRWQHQELSGNEWNETWRVFQHVSGKKWIESVCSHPKFEQNTFTEIGRTDEYIELERQLETGKVVVRIYKTYFELGPTREQLHRGASGAWTKQE